jgi:hypothetical protein
MRLAAVAAILVIVAGVSFASCESEPVPNPRSGVSERNER